MTLTRRTVLLAGAASPALLVLRPARAGGLVITSRSAWGGDLAPQGPLEAEAPGDVRFLLVHHTAGTNDYSADEVPELLRSIYAFHTGEKGWADVAYNFFVDRFGGVWEGRTGSIGAPIKGDATGGSQGFAVLCCLLGTFTTEPPTAAARASLTALLAMLADTYGIDTAPAATATFVSRGSNRWPAGAEVTTPTISGHRDMSATACPGDAVYALIADRSLAIETTALRTGLAPATTSTSTSSSTTTTATTADTTSSSVSTTEVAVASTSTAAGSSPVVTATRESGRIGLPLAVGAAAATMAAAGAVALRIRSRRGG